MTASMCIDLTHRFVHSIYDHYFIPLFKVKTKENGSCDDKML